MLEKEEIIQKIMKETGKPRRLAAVMADGVDNIRPELMPCVATWMNGKKLEFSYQGVTLEEIMEKEHCSYIEAIFSMQVLLDNPQMAERYKNFNFRRK